MALQGSKLTSGASLFVKLRWILIVSRKQYIKFLNGRKDFFFPISTGKFPVRTKSEAAEYDFPVSFLFFFYFLTFCVILGPPTSKCQDRIKCLWEEVGRQGWASCQISVWVWLQVKERGRKEAGRLGEGLWEHSTVWGRFGRAVREFWSQSHLSADPCVS